MPGHTENAIFIAAPIGLTWDLTNDVERWPTLFGEYASVEVLHRDRTVIRFRLTTHPDHHGKVQSWVSERISDPVRHTVRARRIETGPFEYMDIFWNYTDISGAATRLLWIQDFAMRPDAPVDDAAMVSRIDFNSGVRLELIRRHVEERAWKLTRTKRN